VAGTETQTDGELCVSRRQEGTYLGRDRRRLVLSDTDSPNLKTAGMNHSSTAEPESAEEFTKSDNPRTNSLFISEKKGTSSLMTTIVIVTGVLSACILIAGSIILVVLVKKLRDSPNAAQNSTVYDPGQRTGRFQLNH